MRHTAPCKDCLDREPHCHSNCPKYLEWKTEIDEQKVLRNREQAAIPLICRKVLRQIWREQRWK